MLNPPLSELRFRIRDLFLVSKTCVWEVWVRVEPFFDVWEILGTFKENENDGFGGSDPYPIFGCFCEKMGDPCLQTGKGRVAQEN